MTKTRKFTEVCKFIAKIIGVLILKGRTINLYLVVHIWRSNGARDKTGLHKIRDERVYKLTKLSYTNAFSLKITRLAISGYKNVDVVVYWAC